MREGFEAEEEVFLPPLDVDMALATRDQCTVLI